MCLAVLHLSNSAFKKYVFAYNEFTYMVTFKT